MGMSVNGRGGSGQVMSDINVTPFVDVMLVLLIIFMVTAPMMTQGVDVKVPESSSPAIPSEDERLVVTVTQDKKVYINEHVVDVAALGPKLAAMYQNQPSQKGVFLRADENLSYGYVMEVMGLIREAGIDQIGMVTEPFKGMMPQPKKK